MVLTKFHILLFLCCFPFSECYAQPGVDLPPIWASVLAWALVGWKRVPLMSDSRLTCRTMVHAGGKASLRCCWPCEEGHPHARNTTMGLQQAVPAGFLQLVLLLSVLLLPQRPGGGTRTMSVMSTTPKYKKIKQSPLASH